MMDLPGNRCGPKLPRSQRVDLASTSTGDVGIDGQLEFVKLEGFAISRIIAMQVKAGPSPTSGT